MLKTSLFTPAHSTLTETTEDSWMVLLDAAALVPTSPLDLKANGADFVCISFYKMFGFPTGGLIIIHPCVLISSTILCLGDCARLL